MRPRDLIWIALIMTACSDSNSETALEKGWAAFSAGSYEQAVVLLSKARDKHPDDPEIRAALGWTWMRLDSLADAKLELDAGAALPDAPLELHAGRAFLYNAFKDFTASNGSAETVLSADPDWFFRYDAGINAIDLQIMVAENYFLLTEFQTSLAAVIELNPSFAADISTDAGKGLLAGEIERLYSIHGGRQLFRLF